MLNATAPPGASRRAAAASAAYTALSALLPSQQAAFDAQYASTLASLPAGSQSVARGLAWGQTVADAMLAWRSTDGFTAVLPPYVTGPLPFWQPTPPGFVATPVFRAVRDDDSVDDVVVGTVPAAAAARVDQRSLHRLLPGGEEHRQCGDSHARRRRDGQVLGRPVRHPGHDVGSRCRVAGCPRARLVDTARLYAFLNASMADAMIAIWNAKNVYNAWRPVTAIRNADMDGNPAAALDTTWTPVLTTPAHQEYPSGHTGVSSAATGVLASFFGNRTAFTITSDGLPAPSNARTYMRFSDAIADVTLARVAAGIHFRFSCDVAADMGADVARQALRTEMERRKGRKK